MAFPWTYAPGVYAFRLTVPACDPDPKIAYPLSRRRLFVSTNP